MSATARGVRTRAVRAQSPERARAWLWAGGQVGLIAAESFLILLLLAHPALRARDVQASGAEHVPQAEVVEALALPPGRSMFLLDHRALEARLRALPWVRSARVSLELPNRVKVSVREWAPVAVFQRGERLYFVNERGTLMGPAAEPGNLPILLRPSFSAVREGATPIPPELLALLLPIKDGFPAAFKMQVSGFSLDEQGSLSLRTDRGWPIIFGEMNTADQRATLEPKLAALQALSTRIDFGRAPIAYINVMDPRHPAYQLKGK